MPRIPHPDLHGPCMTEVLLVNDILMDIADLPIYERCRLIDAMKEAFCMECGDIKRECDCAISETP